MKNETGHTHHNSFVPFQSDGDKGHRQQCASWSPNAVFGVFFGGNRYKYFGNKISNDRIINFNPRR
jgi:UDP-2,3-diacylglucosamine pyrophosphatase LpxH